jgi:hypothetical protein
VIHGWRPPLGRQMLDGAGREGGSANDFRIRICGVSLGTAADVRKPLHVFSTKRFTRSRSCKPVRQESHILIETQTGVMGIEAFHEMLPQSVLQHSGKVQLQAATCV